MKPPPEKEALRRVAELLGNALKGRPAKPVFLAGPGADARVQAGGWTFLVEWKSTSDVAAVRPAAAQLRRLQDELDEQSLAVLAVPYMGEAGQRACEEAGAAWLDLAGNAHLDAPGLRILVRGQPNPFTRRGRPSSPFAPKSSRITRWLLMNPGQFVSQRELASLTEVGEGYTSRVVRRLEERRLIERNEAGAVRALDPDLLLDAWAEDYDFGAHHVIRGHVAVRSGEELLESVPAVLADGESRYAATGLAGAWLLTGFATFRTATFYVSSIPAARTLKALGFHEEDMGANLWWVLPKDEGVFHGASEVGGVHCAHPVQVWLDLAAHPERAPEAADSVRKGLLKWKKSRA